MQPLTQCHPSYCKWIKCRVVYFFIIVDKKRTPSCVFVGQRYINRYFKITTTLIVFRMIYDPIRVKRNEQKLLVWFNFHIFVFLLAPMATSRERSLGAAFSPTRSRSKNCTAMDLLVQRSSSSGYQKAYLQFGLTQNREEQPFKVITYISFAIYSRYTLKLRKINFLPFLI